MKSLYEAMQRSLPGTALLLRALTACLHLHRLSHVWAQLCCLLHFSPELFLPSLCSQPLVNHLCFGELTQTCAGGGGQSFQLPQNLLDFLSERGGGFASSCSKSFSLAFAELLLQVLFHSVSDPPRDLHESHALSPRGACKHKPSNKLALRNFIGVQNCPRNASVDVIWESATPLVVGWLLGGVRLEGREGFWKKWVCSTKV